MRRRSVARSDLPRSILLGAALGGALGGVFLLIGLVGFAVFRLLGADVQPITWADLRLMAFYVGGFTLAGAFVGLFRPFLGYRRAVYAVAAVGGAIAMNVVAISDKGITDMDRVDWLAMSVMGVVFGLAGARFFLGKPEG